MRVIEPSAQGKAAVWGSSTASTSVFSADERGQSHHFDTAAIKGARSHLLAALEPDLLAI